MDPRWTCVGLRIVGLAATVAATGACAAGNESASPQPCSVSISVTPVSPVATVDEVRASAVVHDADGVYDYAWRVEFDGMTVAHADAQADGSAIEFAPLEPGIYRVTLNVSAASSCPRAEATINVRDPDGGEDELRVLFVPPPSIAPPSSRIYRLAAGADFALGPVVLEPGVAVNGSVTSGGVGVPAYLKLEPIGMTGAPVEVFAGASGAFTALVHNQMHDALVIPSGNVIPPHRVSWGPSAPAITLTAGTAISGSVVANGAPVANAKVLLVLDGVPTTLGTTAADGTFSVRSSRSTAMTTRVVVTPPMSSGRPRLEAEGTLDVTQLVRIAFLDDTRDVGGVQVRRGGAPLANARVSIVGTIAQAATVTSGQNGAALATGIVRVQATTNGNGMLPAALAPAVPLQLVAQLDTPALDYGIAAFDLTGTPASSVSIPAMATKTVSVGTPALEGVRLAIVPTGSLALAGIPVVEQSTSATGVSVSLAPSAGYDLVWTDPARRAGHLIVRGVSSLGLGSSYALPQAIDLTGTLSVTGNPNRLAGAAVQVFCTGCGSDPHAARPLAEAVSDDAGAFVLALPDPGAM